ncbi:MAG: hypothetical protein WC558_07930 [Patulibacter sp.]
MRSIINRRPTVSTVISCTALFVALGGTSYAAVTMDGKDLKNRSVAATKIKTRTLTGTQIKNDGLTGKQIKESTLGTVPRATAADAATRATTADKASVADKATTADKAVSADKATTADKATDAQTLNGRDHTKFLSSQTRIVRADSAPVVGSDGGNPEDVTASCGPGERAISGGGAWIIPNFQDNNTPSALDLPITGTMPVETAPGSGEVTGWRVTGRNFSGTSRILRAYVICTPKS